MKLPSLVFLLCVPASPLLRQEPPYVSALSGSKVTLRCDVAPMSGRCSDVVWLHVGPLGALGVSRRFTRGAGGQTTCLLEISGAAPRDAGRYYCVHINGLMLVIGGGTTLAVAESELRSPAVDLLVPSDRRGDSSLPVPVVCLASGLGDPGRASVDLRVEDMRTDGVQTPLPHGEGGVISKQVSVPAESWTAGVEVSCELSHPDVNITKTVSSKPGTADPCVLLTSVLGAGCVLLFTVTVTLSILLSCQQRRHKQRPERTSKINREESELHYAALRFVSAGQRSAARSNRQ